MRFRITTFHFLDNLHRIKYILLTIVFNGILSLCKTLHLKDHDSFLTITLNGSRPLLIKFFDILALWCMPIRIRKTLLYATFKWRRQCNNAIVKSNKQNFMWHRFCLVTSVLPCDPYVCFTHWIIWYILVVKYTGKGTIATLDVCIFVVVFAIWVICTFSDDWGCGSSWNSL